MISYEYVQEDVLHAEHLTISHLSLLVAKSNSSFYCGWSLSQSVTESLTYVTMQHVHAPVTCVYAFATRGFESLFLWEELSDRLIIIHTIS